MENSGRRVLLEEDGSIVIPEDIREIIHAKSGDEILFIVEDEIVHITTRIAIVKRLKGVFKTNDGRDHTEEFLEERRQEAARKWS